MSLVPSPFQRLASATVTGLVGLGAQTFAGVKTFTSALVASAGIQLASLFNTNGAGSTDVVVQLGTSLADGSVNAGAKLLQLGTGVGGAFVEKWYVLKNGSPGVNADGVATRIGPNNANFTSAGSGSTVTCNTYFEVAAGANINVDTVYPHAATTMTVLGQLGAGATDVVNKTGSNVADASVNAGAKLWSLRTGIGGTEVEHLYAVKGGTIFGGASALAKVTLNDTSGAVLSYNGNGLVCAVSSASLAGQGVDLNATAAALTLRSGLGAGASDVVTKTGSTVADGSVNATAKLWSLRTGLGGTEVEKTYIDKSGAFITAGQVSTSSASGAGGFAFGGTAVLWESGSTLVLRARGAAANYDSTTPAIWLLPFGALDPADLVVSVATSAGAGIVTFNASGRIDQLGTDFSASPGAQTVNKGSGKCAIAAGASSVVITNSMVSATSRVMITPHARDATCKELIAVPAAGSFTVSGTANATAALPFSWEVSNIL